MMNGKTNPSSSDEPPRLVPDQPLPPYSYVTGHFPHPLRDASGHHYGQDEPPPPPVRTSRWSDSRAYLVGIDLFNHGYYWEAHEVWEGLWHACGRRGLVGDFIKGLIKLAAAGVKARERNPVGVARHARRAAELFQHTRAECGKPTMLGLPLEQLIDAAQRLEEHPPRSPAADQLPPVEILLDLQLRPGPH